MKEKPWYYILERRPTVKTKITALYYVLKQGENNFGQVKGGLATSKTWAGKNEKEEDDDDDDAVLSQNE